MRQDTSTELPSPPKHRDQAAAPSPRQHRAPTPARVSSLGHLPPGCQPQQQARGHLGHGVCPNGDAGKVPLPFPRLSWYRSSSGSHNPAAKGCQRDGQDPVPINSAIHNVMPTGLGLQTTPKPQAFCSGANMSWVFCPEASPDSSMGSLSRDFLTWSDSPVSELSSIFRSFPWIRIPSDGKRSPRRGAKTGVGPSPTCHSSPCPAVSQEDSGVSKRTQNSASEQAQR